VFICIFSLVTFMRSVYWADEFELSIAEQTHHPLSSRANIMLGIKYGLIAEANEEKRDQFYELAKDWTGPSTRTGFLFWRPAWNTRPSR
jgi:hypothetical protein